MLPARTADTMSMVIGMTSPSARMSKAAKARATRQIEVALFGEAGFSAAISSKIPTQPTDKERDLRRAKELRDMAARGMKPRAFLKEALALEAKYA